MALPRDEARFLAGVARDERKLLRQIFLLAAELVERGEEFSCNAISKACKDLNAIHLAYNLREAYTQLYKIQQQWDLAWQIEREHHLPEGGLDYEGRQSHRVFMLLFAREMVRTGDFE